jgi:signal transduction histidine kinase
MTASTKPVSRAKLLALIAQLQEQRESERHTLARRLHDELGGLLAATRMALSNLQARAAAGPRAAVTESLAAAEQQLVLALAIERHAVEGLRPGLLEHFGPAAALQAHFEQGCRASGLSLQLTVPAEPLPLAPPAALALYRVGEAVLARAANCGARYVDLSLQRRGRSCTLRIRHDGGEADPQTAIGFIGLQLLVARLGGRLSATRTRAAGFAVVARLPLQAPRR